MDATTIALWAMFISGATLLTYLGQLVVLILVYRRVIKETDQNAKEREQQLTKAGDMMQQMGKEMEQGLNKIALRNTVGFAVMAACAAIMFSMARSTLHKVEAKTKDK